jgi:serine phosphatase RsbU (regulator of sigma subunit)/pSer/pThr/pTyr-binding forkhead associated (FHA) protein
MAVPHRLEVWVRPNSVMAQLNFVKGANQGSSVELVGDRIVLGRNADCNVVLNVPAVSREHAVIRKIQGKYYIEDMKSRNGTFVNNKEVSTRTLLKDNDKIKICDNILAFFENPPKAPIPDHMRGGEADVDDEPDSSTVEATLSQSSKQVLEAQPAEKLAMLLDLGAELSQTFSLELLLPKVVDKLFNVFRHADRAFIIMVDEGKLIPRVTKTRREGEEEKAIFSKRIIAQCVEKNESVLSEDATSDKRFDLSQSIADCKIRSVMCVPLVGRSSPRPFGVIQLDTQDRFKKFTQDDLKMLLSVAGQAAVAVENARMYESLLSRRELERDLRLANQVQKSFLPKRPPQVAGYHFFAHYESAQEVGGDYYDFVPLPDSRCAVMIGDVAGKGVPAALLMAKVASDARFSMLTEKTLADAVSKLNEQMQEAGMLDRFVTLGACLLDSNLHQVTVVNAGHVPPMIYRKASDAFEEAMPRSHAGLPLGVADGIAYESVTTTLEPGDSVLLFTDGVTEAQNKDDQDLKMTGALEALKAAPRTPQGFVEHLIATVREFAKGRKPHDDITVVAFGRQ